MMCLADSPVIDSVGAAAAFADMVVMVLKQMNRQGILKKSGTSGCNFMHMLCSRGHLVAVQRILTVFGQGDFPLLDKEFIFMPGRTDQVRNHFTLILP